MLVPDIGYAFVQRVETKRARRELTGIYVGKKEPAESAEREEIEYSCSRLASDLRQNIFQLEFEVSMFFEF